ncbi:hypothetical protein PR048_008291 [Dryococelus australis]|uniref:Uncharacterized protein n=1 Tax=Dryococelus australis TaxID=614101 RepID=A0ABQ9HWP4_9NEOP|nr:hypothetical protein PR048_008291 [Dryococelus australis]
MGQLRNAMVGETGDSRDQRHRPARFPSANIGDRPRRETNLVRLGGRRVVYHFNTAAPRIGGGGRREIPERTRRPMASSGTIPTYVNPVTRPGIEPGSPWCEASVLIAQPPPRRPVITRGSTFTRHQEPAPYSPRPE